MKTSHRSSRVSEGQISFLLPRFIRQLIKGGRSIEGDSALTPRIAEEGRRKIKGPFGMKADRRQSPERSARVADVDWKAFKRGIW